MGEVTCTEDRARFEVLPFPGIVEEAARLPRPVRMAVTCSPKQGPDRAVEVAARLRRLDHSLTVHVAARMVRDRDHLDQLLAGLADAAVDDLFLIGGDIEEPVGEYASAVDLLPLVVDHARRPGMIGIAGYPEGHPRISVEELERALRDKSRLADYVVTQMCFDPEALHTWIVRQREHGMELPVVIGMPGKVARRKLLTMSARIGVGPSFDFLRRQKGLRRLLARRSTADRLYDGIAPLLDDPELAVAGFQYFTFNELLKTWEWHQKKLASDPKGSNGVPARRGTVGHTETSTQESR
ncbi:MAG: methylenetetrahydrofolate reductase [Thermoleophilaceae bacterium]|nr:methylenetetrahydrofolate reductase [Thermoleophilaceae bacterium]